jgi:hypothetical protein
MPNFPAGDDRRSSWVTSARVWRGRGPRALAVSVVLVHEAFHLRHWRYRRDEGKVECQAMVYFTEAAQKLGASADEADNLYPYALAWHRWLTQRLPWYRDPACVIPPWTPPVP